MSRPHYDELSSVYRRRKTFYPAIAIFLMAFLALLLIYPVTALGQATPTPWDEGVKIYKQGQCADGYTLFLYPPNSARLIDMNGNKVKEWTPAPDGYGMLVKPLPGGSVLGHGAAHSANGEFSKVVQTGPDNEVTWSYSDWTVAGAAKSAEAHHDLQREGNPVGYWAPGMDPKVTGGKTLILANTKAINPAVSWWQLTDPVIYEVDWSGNPTGFEWHAIDHFNEFGFNDAAKWQIFWLGGFFGDYLHMNSISTLGPNKWYDAGDTRFHPDNIITSNRSANLMFIIDRQTGKIVYKIGPDYSSSTPEGQKLGQIIGQHHAHMIPRGLPGEGNILVFDNGGVGGYPGQWRLYSRVIEFNPVTLDIVWEYKDLEGVIWAPSGPDRLFFSYFISGMQRLPNGNTLITEGGPGRLLEVTPENEVVWEYILGGWRFIYRAYRVPADWVPGNPNAYPLWGSP